MSRVQEFELTEDHISLLRASYVRERLSSCEYGAAEIDGKRPYGNSDVVSDIAEVLGLDVFHNEYGEEDLHPEDRARCRRLHGETPIALQIVLSVGAFQPGTYVRAEYYDKDWKLKE